MKFGWQSLKLPLEHEPIILSINLNNVLTFCELVINLMSCNATKEFVGIYPIIVMSCIK